MLLAYKEFYLRLTQYLHEQYIKTVKKKLSLIYT